MKINKIHIIGLIVTLCIGATIWGMNYLDGINIFSRETTLYVVYNNIDGLGISKPVYLNGYQVGQVRQIGFTDDNTGRLLVRLGLSPDLKYADNTIAMLYDSDLLGGKAIELKLGDSKEYLKSGDTLVAEIQLSLFEKAEPYKEKADNIINKIDSMLSVIQAGFNAQTAVHLNNIIANLDSTTRQLKSASYALNRNKLASIITNIDSLTTTLKRNSKNLDRLAKNLASASDSLSESNLRQLIDESGKSMAELHEILERMNKGEGTLGALSHNDSLYINLKNATKSLDLLLKDLKEHPKRYVHFSLVGKKDKAKKEEE